MGPPDAPDALDESVFDAYLAASAAGRAEAPEALFARHPGLGAEVRSRIEGLWLATSLRGAGAPPSREMDRLGPYRLLERLDSGGMGTVFRAVRDPDGAAFAVKVLRPELAGSATAAERLRREALALSRVRHGSVVRVHAFGEDRGASYLVLDLVPGRGLDEVLSEAALREEPLDPARVARWGAALARGLQAAHEEGVIHRDVKPSNVRLRPDDTPLLLDFGIATVPDRTPGALTTSFAGSPFYAAPEQLAGTPVDGRADVYGLCATLYQCLAGRVPFGGDRFDAVLRRVLTEAPVPPRRFAPGVPVALETVVLAGLEKDPARRPPSAAALADDIEAAIAGAPILSRRAGPVRRLGRWARARPLAAAALLLAGAIAVGAPLATALSRRAEARAALEEAERGAAAFEADGARELELEASVLVLRERARQEWLPDGELDRIGELEGRLASVRRDRDAAFHGLLGLLDRAERLAPGMERARACRAGLYLRRWRAAVAAGDAAAAAFYRSLVERADPGGASVRELGAAVSLRVVAEPADAEVHLFRVAIRADLVPRGGQRLVPAPLRGWPAGLPPAPWALRVAASGGGIREGDLVLRVAGHLLEDCVLAGAAAPPLRALDRIVSIGGLAVRDEADARRLGAEGPERPFVFERGGERRTLAAVSLAALGVEPLSPAAALRSAGGPATLWRDGETIEATLPPGLDLRTTAAPLLPGPASLAGRGDTGLLRLPPGEYAVLLRREGFADLREAVNLGVPGLGQEVRALLLPAAERPPGCVRVAAARAWETGVPASPFWIRETEATAGEYLEFLNDPATLAAVDAATRPVLVPRHEVDPPLWPRGEDGRFRLPPGTLPSHPVLGVSFEDALAYARWLTGRAEARGEPWTWRLPTHREWLQAAGAALRRPYPFGPRFDPRWASSCYSRPVPAPEPVLSFPVDESPYGVFDACGGAMEWVDGWYDERRGLRRLAGGSWAQGEASALLIFSPRGARPDRADREFGFRLVGEARRP